MELAKRLRQTEGFTKSILKIMKITLPIPDYTTVSRRVRGLSVNFVTINIFIRMH